MYEIWKPEKKMKKQLIALDTKVNGWIPDFFSAMEWLVGGWFTNPFEKYAQVKLESIFPK